jgi:hypothetical protein
MSLNTEERASFEIVLKVLLAELDQVQEQLSPLQAKQKELHHSINTISARLTPDPLLPTRPLTARSASQKYTHMSVRWAILDLLSDAAALSTAEVAEELLNHGVQTKAANFANNASAVLGSMMKGSHKEVQQTSDGKWQLNENGKQAITYIRTTPKFRRALYGNG